jgi:hypothetical protein
MEEEWVIDRIKLRDLLASNPDSPIEELKTTIGRSADFVCKWKRRFLSGQSDDQSLVRSQSRRRKQLPAPLDARVEAAILAVRDQPPAQLGRTPGPRCIRALLKRDETFLELGLPVPCTTKIWQVLVQHQRILRCVPVKHKEIIRPAPMSEWEIDFTDVDTAPAEPDGKQQHAVELLNVVDRGTSILVDSLPASDYSEETTVIALVDVFMKAGLPQAIRLDRDPRFVASWTIDGFPSALVRFLMCLGVRVDVCPPHRPDLKPFVERFNKTVKYELILPNKPTTVPETAELVQGYKPYFNDERPHQGLANHDLPPHVAFPILPVLPRLPATIDADSWLKGFHLTYFKRRVSANGVVVVDDDSYYVGKRLAGQYVLLRLDAPAQCFHVELGGKPVKDLPIKCLLGGRMTFEEYIELIIKQARSETRRLALAARQRLRLAPRAV